MIYEIWPQNGNPQYLIRKWRCAKISEDQLGQGGEEGGDEAKEEGEDEGEEGGRRRRGGRGRDKTMLMSSLKSLHMAA